VANPGTETLEFECAFAAFHGAQHGVTVTNGTAALEVVMAALEVGTAPAMPDCTFIATASAFLLRGLGNGLDSAAGLTGRRGRHA